MIYWQTAALFIIGMLQGINLVAFPAVSPILTSAQGFNYSNSAYGYLFLPQVILSIVFSFLSTEIALRGKIKIAGSSGIYKVAERHPHLDAGRKWLAEA